jgi:predicted ester cyclase
VSASENKASFRKIPEQIFNTGDLAAADAVMKADYTEHIPMPAGFTPDREGFKKFVTMWRSAVPDLHYTVTHFTGEDLIGEGDFVVNRVVGRGTQTGEFMGIPPTGHHLEWTETHIGRYADGMLVEHWGQIDVMSILQELGVVPGGGEKPPEPAPIEVADARQTSPEENKAIMRRMIEEVWNKGDLDVADEIFHPEATSPCAAQLPVGPTGLKMIAGMFRSAFPDFHMSIDDMIAEGPFVVGRFTETGTHLGDLMGIPPTGKPVSFGEIGILRIANGQVVESWYDVDMAGLMQQLGVAG